MTNFQQAARYRAILLGLFEATVFGVLLYVIVRAQWIPVGAAGQPRAEPLSADWVVPWQLTSLYVVIVGVLAAAPWYPWLGVIGYLCLSFAFPVHEPEWIYTRAIGLRSLVAFLTLAGALLHRTLQQSSGSNVATDGGLTKVDRLLVAFVAWNLICAVASVVRWHEFHPALQFHPIQLVEALSVFAAVRILGGRDRALTYIALAVVATLTIRILLNGLTYRDAGIASDVVIVLPLLGFLIVRSPNVLRKIWGLTVAAAALWSIYSVQNRGSAVAILFAVAALLLTAKRRFWAFAVGGGAAVAVIVVISQSSFGDRFRSIGSLSRIWNENERVQMWRASGELAVDHWLFGVGPGNYVHAIGRYDPEFADHTAHNLFVDIACESGVVGLALYIALLVSVVAAATANGSRGCVASRCALISTASFLGVGLFLTTTMFTLPYLLFAIPAIGDPESGSRDPPVDG